MTPVAVLSPARLAVREPAPNAARGIEWEPVTGARIAGELGAWRTLVRDAPSLWLPFQEPDWSTTWAQHFAGGSDRFVLWLGRDGTGALRAALPTVLTERPRNGPFRLRLLYAVGPDPNLTELQPLVSAPEDATAAHVGLARALFAKARSWDGFRWASVPSGVAGVLRARPGVETVKQVPDYVLALGPSWEEFRSSLPRNVKEAIRKARNAPQRAGLALRFAVVEQPEALQALLPEFLRLHAARAEASELTRHPDAFATGDARRFLASLLQHWSRRRVAVMFTLWDRDRLVASRLAFRMRNALYLYFSGFDPQYAQYSVMTRTLAEGLEWAARAGATVVNLSTGTDVSKTRWRPACLEYETQWQWSQSWRGRLARALHRRFGRDRHP